MAKHRGKSSDLEVAGLVVIRNGQVLRWQTWATSGSYVYSPIKIIRLPNKQGFLCFTWDGINGEKRHEGQTARGVIYSALSRQERRGLRLVRLFNRHGLTREIAEKLFPGFEIVRLADIKRT